METILITGGLGRIGQVLCREFRGRYRTRSFDLRPSPAADESVAGNITDVPALVRACRGVRAIVHLAAIPGNADFNLLLDTNIRGTYCVYEAAVQAGVRKVVFASTNHVSGMWERSGVYTTPEMPIRPDSLYAVSKAAGEALARHYADAHGISSVCIRIGAFNAQESKPRGLRDYYMLITHRDIAQLVDRAIQWEGLFAIVNGISNHPKAYQDLESAREWLGYQPQDGAEDWLDLLSPEQREQYNALQWRRLSREEMIQEWLSVQAPPRRR
ncbi:MAG: NAD-dependent epimerase [Candidatus Poribacteria bacterium]|nr:MAG: NAD-dependent epimerase [Candidatus Poribacteria bacterium]